MKKNKLEKELDHSKPKLFAEIGITAVAPAGEKNENSLLIFTATIKNTGAPSIASDFKLLVKIDGKETIGHFLPSLKETRLLSTKGQEILLNFNDNLVIKSGSQPIVSGGAVTGFCSVLISNVIQEDISSKGIIILNFKDVYENNYAVEYNMASTGPFEFIDPNKIQKRD